MHILENPKKVHFFNYFEFLESSEIIKDPKSIFSVLFVRPVSDLENRELYISNKLLLKFFNNCFSFSFFYLPI